MTLMEFHSDLADGISQQEKEQRPLMRRDLTVFTLKSFNPQRHTEVERQSCSQPRKVKCGANGMVKGGNERRQDAITTCFVTRNAIYVDLRSSSRKVIILILLDFGQSTISNENSLFCHFFFIIGKVQLKK